MILSYTNRGFMFFLPLHQWQVRVVYLKFEVEAVVNHTPGHGGVSFMSRAKLLVKQKPCLAWTLPQWTCNDSSIGHLPSPLCQSPPLQCSYTSPSTYYCFTSLCCSHFLFVVGEWFLFIPDFLQQGLISLIITPLESIQSSCTTSDSHSFFWQ